MVAAINLFDDSNTRRFETVSNRRSLRWLNDRLLMELVPRLNAEEIRGLFTPPPWGLYFLSRLRRRIAFFNKMTSFAKNCIFLTSFSPSATLHIMFVFAIYGIETMAIPFITKKIVKKHVKQFKRTQSDWKISMKELLRRGHAKSSGGVNLLYIVLVG
ncbi:hypothetical protein LOK49_LG11G01188 [Camellia lanceoleosa]|uniref:Uncharacterized protein n=1 Tax=Camellia lanceoleosa TaxID=1840588 RepID=A0ACC0G430_9ERIC|nr:hypothetical protein LOK49_LG11G01188 [Camellia lanceoleosa]